MYEHVSHPKKGAAIAQLPKARQDALVGSSTASRTHELCHHGQPIRTAAKQAHVCGLSLTFSTLQSEGMHVQVS